jgi:hypothetical protein
LGRFEPGERRHVLALDIARFLQALEERNGDILVVSFSGLGAEEPDHWVERLEASPMQPSSVSNVSLQGRR